MKVIVVVTALLPFIFSNVRALSNQELASSTSLFTAAVYKEAVKNGDENLLVSPLSAEIVLALTQSGAKGKTAEEIRSVLHLSQNNDEIKTGFKNFLQILKGNEDFTLHTANKIYIRKNLGIKDEFSKSATDSYQAEIENVDFSKSVEAANTINQWVEEKTEHKIKNLVDPGSISGGTPAIIVNTLYFKANWTDRDFHKFPLLKKDFYRTSQDVIKVDTMAKFGDYLNFYEDEQVKAKFLELPLLGEDANMIIVLPNEKEGLSELEKQPEKVFKSHNFEKTTVDVTLPLFKFESQIDFKKILQNLGIRKAFDASEADFSDIAGNKGELVVSDVLQKTFINVNRDGIEAAAATNLIFAMSGPLPGKQVFNVDHPFIFYIQVKGVILFAGKVSNPKN